MSRRAVLLRLHRQLGGAMRGSLWQSSMTRSIGSLLPPGRAAVATLAPCARRLAQLRGCHLPSCSQAGAQAWPRGFASDPSSSRNARLQPAPVHASQLSSVPAAERDDAGGIVEAETLREPTHDTAGLQKVVSTEEDAEAGSLQQQSAAASHINSSSQAEQPAELSEDAAAPASASDVTHPEPPTLPEDLASCWATFLSVLHDRGFFPADANPSKHIATQNKRDVKKALQQLGRQRPDALFALPPPAMHTLAAAGLPEGMAPERKSTAAATRLQRSYVAGAASNRDGASLQDALRVVLAWARPSAGRESEGGEEAQLMHIEVPKGLPEAIHAVLSATLAATTAPPDPAAIARACSATATPDMAALQAWAERKAQGTDGSPASSAEAGGRANKYTPRQEVNHLLVDAHKQRLARAVANKVRLVRGDWFCGSCSTRNYKSIQACVRCGVPADSLGCSVVSVRDIKELESQGLLLAPRVYVRDAEGSGGGAQEGREGASSQHAGEGGGGDGERRSADGRVKKPRWEWSARAERRSGEAQGRSQDAEGNVAGAGVGESRSVDASSSSRDGGGRRSEASSQWKGPVRREEQQRGYGESGRGGRGYGESSRGGRGDGASRSYGESSRGGNSYGESGRAARGYGESRSYGESGRGGRGYGESGRGGRGGRSARSDDDFGSTRDDRSSDDRGSSRERGRGGRGGSDRWGGRSDTPQGSWSGGGGERSMADSRPGPSSSFDERAPSGQWEEVQEGARSSSSSSTRTRARLFSSDDSSEGGARDRRAGGRGQGGEPSWYEAEEFDRSDAAEAELARLASQGGAGTRETDGYSGRRGRGRGSDGGRGRSDTRGGRGGGRGYAGRFGSADRSGRDDAEFRGSGRGRDDGRRGGRGGRGGGRGRDTDNAEGAGTWTR